MKCSEFPFLLHFNVRQWVNQKICLFISLSILSVLSSPFCMADIYQFVDYNGAVHLTNVPTNPSIPYRMVLKEESKGLYALEDISQYDDLIHTASARYGMDFALIKAIIKAESNFDHRAISSAGAKGLMQIMPETALSFKVYDLFNPGSNIDGGVRYLRYLMHLFNQNITLALAAYNAGENTVIRYNKRVPPYPETRAYIKRVLLYFDEYRCVKKRP